MRISNLFVILGPSGVGKTTVMERLVAKHSDTVKFVPSCTTRPRREGEHGGVHYHFLTEQAFDSLLRTGLLALYTKINNNQYGMTEESILNAMERHPRVLLILDDVGTRQVQKLGLNPVTVFLLPPSIEELGNRLLSLGRDNVEKRVADSEKLILKASDYDYMVVNYNIETAVKEIEGIMAL